MDKQRQPDSTSRLDRPQVTGLKKLIFVLAAGFFLVLGVLGVAIPGLPTTPFLLLTSYFLVRVSPKLNRKLLASHFIGPILTDWQVQRGVRRDIKVKAIIVVVIAVSATIYFSTTPPWLTGGVIVVALIGVFVIIRLPTLESTQPTASKKHPL